MTGGVEVNADVLLRLEVREPRTRGFGLGGGFGEVVGFDVEVQPHLLVAGARGPDRRHVVRLQLDVPSTCTEQVKRDYLISGAFPAAGKTCAVDASPFAG
jgi:hypothetical protein